MASPHGHYGYEMNSHYRHSQPAYENYTNAETPFISSGHYGGPMYERQQQQYISPSSSKIYPQTTSQAFSTADAPAPVPARKHPKQWHQGLFKTTPWVGLLGMVGTVLSAAAIVAVLLSADGKPTDAWPSDTTQVSLSVVLAVLVGVGNAALTMAYREGTTVSWWVKMVKGGSLYDSHRHWQHGSSAFEAIMGLMHLSKVTLVCIVMLLLIVDGPLLQRAAGFTTVTESAPATFKAALSPDPIGQPTAYYMTRARAVNALSGNFSRVVMKYTNQEPISIDLKGCEGSCSGTLLAAGFDIKCEKDHTDYDLTDIDAGDEVTIGSVGISADGIGSPGLLEISSSHKPSADNKGKLVNTRCSLHSAQIEYPFRYTNGTVTLEGAVTSVDDIVNRTIRWTYPDREAAGNTKYPSTLGGFAYALGGIYGSQVRLYNSSSLAILGDGPMQYTSMNSTDDSLGTADMTWIDPTPALLEAVRELTFRTAIAFSDSSVEQDVQGTQLRTTTKYVLHVEWLGGAVAILLIGVVAVVFLYNGFWLLGRPVSMSPLETATALQAPMTAPANSNAKADDIAKQLGKQSVRYQTVHLSDGTPRRAIVPTTGMR